MLDSKHKFQARVIRYSWLAACLVVLVWGANGIAQNQTDTAKMVKSHTPGVQQPLYTEYRGVRLDMTMDEARAKLGEPVLKSEDLDFYVFSDHETAQVAYNTAHKVVTISIDYTGGAGAPDYRTVVGESLLERPDGSVYRMIHYQAQGFWVSYNKSAGAVPMVTITLQKIAK